MVQCNAHRLAVDDDIIIVGCRPHPMLRMYVCVSRGQARANRLLTPAGPSFFFRRHRPHADCPGPGPSTPGTPGPLDVAMDAAFGQEQRQKDTGQTCRQRDREGENRERRLEQASAASPEEKVPSNHFRGVPSLSQAGGVFGSSQTEFDIGRVQYTTWRTRLIYLLSSRADKPSPARSENRS